MIPGLISTQAVGVPTFTTVFDDLKEVGGWPAYQNVKKIIKLEVWFDANKINGIRTEYLKKDGTKETKLRGLTVGTIGVYQLSDEEYLTGIFGAVNEPSNSIKRLGFLIYNKRNGQLTPIGPHPPLATGPENVCGFASIGLVKAFSGTLSATGALDALSVYKVIDAVGDLAQQV